MPAHCPHQSLLDAIPKTVITLPSVLATLAASHQLHLNSGLNHVQESGHWWDPGESWCCHEAAIKVWPSLSGQDLATEQGGVLSLISCGGDGPAQVALDMTHGER